MDANLTHEAFEGNVEATIEAATAAGLTRMLVPGSTIAETKCAVALARERPGMLRCTAGVHPYHAAEALADFGTAQAVGAEVRRTIAEGSDVIVAVGECGLDYSDGFPERQAQLDIFEQQLALACELQLPLFFHERLAFDDAKRLFEQFREKGKTTKQHQHQHHDQQQRLPPVIVHCFTGSQAELEWYLSMDFSVSFSGIICKAERGAAVRALLPSVPRDKLMVETDAPYLGFPRCRQGLAEAPKKQWPNVPSSLPLIVDRMAEERKEDAEDVARFTAENASRFFGWK